MPATAKPQLDGRSKPRPPRSARQRHTPVEPSNGAQLPPSEPRRARHLALARRKGWQGAAQCTRDDGDEIKGLLRAAMQGGIVALPQPASGGGMGTARPPAQAGAATRRSNGAAFMSVGNTQPEVPTKVSRPGHAPRRAAPGAKNHPAVARSGEAARCPRAANGANGLECEVQFALAWRAGTCPAEAAGVKHVQPRPLNSQHFCRHEPGRATANDEPHRKRWRKRQKWQEREDGAWDTGGLWVNVEKMARAVQIRTGSPAWSLAPAAQVGPHRGWQRQGLRPSQPHPPPQRRGREYAPRRGGRGFGATRHHHAPIARQERGMHHLAGHQHRHGLAVACSCATRACWRWGCVALCSPAPTSPPGRRQPARGRTRSRSRRRLWPRHQRGPFMRRSRRPHPGPGAPRPPEMARAMAGRPRRFGGDRGIARGQRQAGQRCGGRAWARTSASHRPHAQQGAWHRMARSRIGGTGMPGLQPGSGAHAAVVHKTARGRLGW